MMFQIFINFYILVTAKRKKELKGGGVEGAEAGVGVTPAVTADEGEPVEEAAPETTEDVAGEHSLMEISGH